MPVTYHYELEQGSPEWLALRKEKVTATSAWRIVDGQPIADILAIKATEPEFTGNKATERGHLLENEARELYASLNDCIVNEVGMVTNSDYPQYACSPDGLVGEDGGIEIKCFQEDRQEAVFENTDHKITCQIQFNLFITGRKWWDWVLYNPEVQDIDKAYHCQRFYPNEAIFAKFRAALNPSEEDPSIQEAALQIVNLEQQLLAQPEEIKQAIAFYQQTKEQIEALKQKLKQLATGKVEKIITLGEDTLKLSITSYTTAKAEDIDQMAEDFYTSQEVPGGYLDENGKVCQKVPLTKKAAESFKDTGEVPAGFTVSLSKRISIKLNGKTL